MHPLLSSLPLLFFLACVARRQRAGGSALLEASLTALLTTVVVTVAITELLGIAGRLRPIPVTLAWLAAVVVAARVPASIAWQRAGGVDNAASNGTPNTRIAAPSVRLPLVLLLGPVIVLTGVTALLAEPNNADSMTYHLSRVEHWLQNGSLAFYPTSIPRQLQFAPLAEYFVLQLRALSGGMAFANLVQWLALLGCCASVASIARRLGANEWSQLAAAVFVVTAPMAILQASSTQTDLVAALFVALTIDRTLAWIAAGYRLRDAATLGAAAAAAVLTKGTASLCLVPLAVWLLLSFLHRRERWILLGGLAAAAIVVLLNAGHLLRSLAAGSLLGPGADNIVSSNSFAHLPARALSSLIRHAGSELMTPSYKVNELIDSLVRGVHRLLGLDINDPATTWKGAAWSPPVNDLNEDFAGNPLHVLATVAALIGVAVWRDGGALLRRYGLVVAAMIVLMGVLLRWQLWITRLHLPLWVAAAPIVGIMIGRLPKIVGGTLLSLLVLAAMPWALGNDLRPLTHVRWHGPTLFDTPPARVLFAARPYLLKRYDEATTFLTAQRAHRIALRMGEDSFEYPLWWLMFRKSIDPVTIVHDCVVNPVLVAPPASDPPPDYVVAIDVPAVDEFDCHGLAYRPVLRAGRILLYAPPRGPSPP
jgi:hypothetical protein